MSFDSPININTKKAESCELEPLKYINMWDPMRSTIITNTGTTVRIKLTGKACIGGGPLCDYYPFDHMLFHWGENNETGSEHTFDCRRFPLEAQFVFIKTVKELVPLRPCSESESDSENDEDEENKEDGAEGEAKAEGEKEDKKDGIDCTEAGPDQYEEVLSLDEEGEEGSEDTLVEVERVKGAVVSVLFEITPDAPCYNLFSYLPSVTACGSQIMVDGNLLSEFRCAFKENDYYTYTGKMTTPPYAECITWIIYRQRLPIRCRDMALFRNLESQNCKHITRNWKDLEPLCGRTVTYARPTCNFVCPDNDIRTRCMDLC